MDRIYASGAIGTAPDVPSSPSHGYPTGGNPSAGMPATKPGAYWFYMITEEIRNAINESGITPDDHALNQLAKAISIKSIDTEIRYKSVSVSGCACLAEI